MIHLRGSGTDLVVDVDTGVPVVVHWGAPLGDDVDATGSGRARKRARPPARAGLARRRRAGRGGARARFGVPRPGRAARSPVARPGVVAALPAGRTRVRRRPARRRGGRSRRPAAAHHHVRARRTRWSCGWSITNEGDDRYMLDGLSVTLPLPEHAGDLLTFHGRHAREFQPYRRPWPSGAVLAENWRGRTSHEHPSLLFAGTVGFGEWQGEVWGVHLAWSGNHDVVAERLPDGRRIVQLGELFHPGEVALEPGESYSTPEVVAVHSADGLTPATWGFHRHLRGRPGHPTTPRPVLLNTWEAVYFDHDTERLCALATAAAERRDRAVRARRRMVRVAPRRHEGSRRLVGLVGDVSRRAGAADHSRAVARDGVRHLGRAGDGEPRQRPATERTPSGRSRPTATSRCSPATNSCSISPTPMRTRTSTSVSTPCCAITTSRSSSGT